LHRSDVEEIVQTAGLLTAYDHPAIDVKRIISQLRELKALPSDAALTFLGYFAILESLLTHAPKSSDPYDSITRQVHTKLSLLNQRFTTPINYVPFRGANSDTVWKRMYKYRSLIAHGELPTFTDELAVLASHDQALFLLRSTTKAVIRQVLAEPRLMADLKNC
jgi:hypothetical protein